MPAAEFRLALVGDSGVGKTSFLRRHITGEFQHKHAPTDGCEKHCLTFGTNCGDLQFSVCDIAGAPTGNGGSQHFLAESLRRTLLIGSHAAIVMFRACDPTSCTNVVRYCSEIMQLCGTIPVVVVANSEDESQTNAEVKSNIVRDGMLSSIRAMNIQSYQVSVSIDLNLEKPFLWLARRLVNQPLLHFVGPAAVVPELFAKLDSTIRLQLAEKLVELELALLMPVSNGDAHASSPKTLPDTPLADAASPAESATAASPAQSAPKAEGRRRGARILRNRSAGAEVELMSAAPGLRHLRESFRGPVHDLDARTVQFVEFETVGSPGSMASSGVLYYEFEVLQTSGQYLDTPSASSYVVGYTQIGFATSKFKVHQQKLPNPEKGVGMDDDSWGVDGARQMTWHDTDSARGKRGRPAGKTWECSWASGDIIGVAANVDVGKIAVSKNGSWARPQGIVFEHKKIQSGVYPCLSARAYKLRYNFEGPFEHSAPDTTIWNEPPLPE